MNTEITKYAPVLIATLNRSEHFIRCFESLERCTGAEFTEVYVALDYPPSNKFEEGWRAIDAFLREKEKSNGFLKLQVIRREHNFGICHENGNYETLIKEIEKKYDRFILTEDDNEFSPCFLQYMNKALEKFYDDDRIFLVCGYNYQMNFPEMYRNNFYLTKHGCPWGTGEWVHKRQELHKFNNLNELKDILFDDKSYQLIMKRAPHVAYSIVSMIKNGALWGDAIKGVYANLCDKYCVMPRLSMVRNWGNDGTGDHSKRLNKQQNDFFTTQQISEDSDFEFTNDIFSYEPEFLERYHYSKTFSLKEWYKKQVQKIDLFLFRNFDLIPKSKYI